MCFTSVEPNSAAPGRSRRGPTSAWDNGRMGNRAGDEAMEAITGLLEKLDWTVEGQTEALMEISKIIGRWSVKRLYDTE